MRVMHVAVHGGINANAGDILLVEATRRCFEHFFGPIAWTAQQAWAPFDAALANQHDAVVIGGGGMLFPDQTGADYAASGWQWNCTLDQLDAVKVPLIVFAIGDNRFRGQVYDIAGLPHFQAVLSKCIMRGFIGLREKDTGWVKYQPCPTTCLWQLWSGEQEAWSRNKEPEILSSRSPLHASRSFPPTPTATGRRLVGVNVAMDRPVRRYPQGDHTAIHAAIAAVCWHLDQAGWGVCVLNHKPEDAAMSSALAAYRVPHAMLNLWDASPEDIVAQYRRLGLVIGMRGHAQLIPFGLRIPIVSVVSHDKVGRFLQDIGHPEWGVDVHEPKFSAILLDIVQHVTQCPRVPHQLEAAQEQLWATTQQNMVDIQARIPAMHSLS